MKLCDAGCGTDAVCEDGKLGLQQQILLLFKIWLVPLCLSDLAGSQTAEHIQQLIVTTPSPASVLLSITYIMHIIEKKRGKHMSLKPHTLTQKLSFLLIINDACSFLSATGFFFFLSLSFMSKCNFIPIWYMVCNISKMPTLLHAHGGTHDLTQMHTVLRVWPLTAAFLYSRKQKKKDVIGCTACSNIFCHSSDLAP